MMKNRGKTGFTLVEIMIVVAVIGLLASIAVPNFVRARSSSRRSVCIANLKKMSEAKITWAMEQNRSNTDTPLDSDLFGPESYLRAKPICPAGGAYALENVALRPTCTQGVVEGHTL